MAKKTPPLLIRGRFTLKMPWVAVPTKLYTVIAIRQFKDIYDAGIDVYSQYYQPMGLTDGAPYGAETFSFQSEVSQLANIVTLYADDGETIFVPDTWILKYPDSGDVKYSHVVLSLSAGAVPDYLDFSALKTMLANLVAQTTGVVVTVNEHRAPSTTQPTAAEHEVLEAARIGAITLLETDYARALRLQAVIDRQNQERATLIAILEDNSLWPPP